jgi:hypothetical protein
MSNDPNKKIIGGGELVLVLGDTVPADDDAYDLGIDFGTINSMSPLNESTTAESMSLYKGIKVRDDIFFTAIKSGFKVTCEEFTDAAHRALNFSAAAVDDTDTDYSIYTPITGANSLKGYGRLRIYDGRDNTNPRIEWRDFKCVIKMSSQPTFDGESYSSYELELQILSDVGTVKVKKVPTPED